MLECKICGKMYKNLAIHISVTHKITSDEYLDKYPNSKLICDESMKKYSIGNSKSAKNQWEREGHREMMSEIHTKKWSEDKEYRDKQSKARSKMGKKGQKIRKLNPDDSRIRSESRKNWIKNNPEKWDEFMRLGVEAAHTEEAKAKRINTMESKYYNDPQWIEKVAETASKTQKELWEDPIYRKNNLPNIFKAQKSSRGTRIKHGDLTFKSSWEYKFALYLEDLDLSYEYEYMSFNYLDENQVLRSYIPDFYIIELDVYVEIHPTSMMDDRMFRKIESVPNIILLTEIELGKFGVFDY